MHSLTWVRSIAEDLPPSSALANLALPGLGQLPTYPHLDTFRDGQGTLIRL